MPFSLFNETYFYPVKQPGVKVVQLGQWARLKVAVNLHSLTVVPQPRGEGKDKCQLLSVPFSSPKGSWASEGQLTWGTDRRECSHCWGAVDQRPLPFKPGIGGVGDGEGKGFWVEKYRVRMEKGEKYKSARARTPPMGLPGLPPM